MVIETFRQGAAPIYERFAEKGRQAPDGLTYLDSWIDAGLNRCFQLMECDDARLLQDWLLSWGDLMQCEIVPVVPSDQTRELVTSRL